MSFSKKQKGFTIIELMVVVAILAILVVWAVPNFGPMLRNYELRAATDRMNTSIAWARAQAIREQQFVVVTPVTAADSWKGGWKVCVDATQAGTCNGTVLKTEDKMPDTILNTPGALSVIQINPSGMIMNSGTIVDLTNGSKTTKISTEMNRVIIK